jgi:hypothetical protein
MSTPKIITNITIFQGAQGKFYIINDKKYDIRFPIDWACNHLSFQIDGVEFTTGPENCSNCDLYGSIREVFVGYCCNCLRQYEEAFCWRGHVIFTGQPVKYLEDKDMWEKYPYMYCISKTEIGDKEDNEILEECLNSAFVFYEENSQISTGCDELF